MVDLACNNYIMWYLSKDNFVFPSFLLHLLIEILLEGKTVPSPQVFMYSFIQLFICITLGSWIFILFCGLHSNIFVVYFVTQIVLTLALENISGGLSCPFKMLPYFFGHFLSFCCHKMFQAHLVFSLP